MAALILGDGEESHLTPANTTHSAALVISAAESSLRVLGQKSNGD
jgi:hypothetical protein